MASTTQSTRKPKKKGKRGSGTRVTADKALGVERQNKALTLRIAGATYAEIGKALSCSTTAAWNAVMRAFERNKAEIADKIEEFRSVEDARLDRMLRALWPLAIGRGNRDDTNYLPPDPKAVDRVLDIMERRAKLFGLDSATKHEVTGANGEPLNAGTDAVATLTSRLAPLLAAAERAEAEAARLDAEASGDASEGAGAATENVLSAADDC